MRESRSCFACKWLFKRSEPFSPWTNAFKTYGVRQRHVGVDSYRYSVVYGLGENGPNDAGEPDGPLTADSDGNLFGTSQYSGHRYGTRPSLR